MATTTGSKEQPLENELRTSAAQLGIEVISVAAVIVKQNQLLLLRRSSQAKVAPGKWHIPGGKVEESETFTAALIRELLEEMSLNLNVLSFSGEWYDYSPNNQIARTYFFHCTATGKPRLNPENQELKFVNLDMIPLLRNDSSAELYQRLLVGHPEYSAKSSK